MSEATQAGASQFSKHRIEALIDGIFAVAMTLLVIDLKLPEHARELDEAALRHALIELLPNLESWVISFVVLAIFWVSSQRLLAHVRHLDAALVRCALLMLAGASLLPFAAAVNSQSSSQVGQAVYAVVLMMMGVALLLMWRHIYRAPELLAHPLDPQVYRAACIRSVGGMMIATLTVPLAYVAPGKANMAFGLMFFLRPVATRLAALWPAGERAAEAEEAPPEASEPAH